MCRRLSRDTLPKIQWPGGNSRGNIRGKKQVSLKGQLSAVKSRGTLTPTNWLNSRATITRACQRGNQQHHAAMRETSWRWPRFTCASPLRHGARTGGRRGAAPAKLRCFRSHSSINPRLSGQKVPRDSDRQLSLPTSSDGPASLRLDGERRGSFRK